MTPAPASDATPEPDRAQHDIGQTAAGSAGDPWQRLAALWPLLAATRFPGTARPWRPADLTPERRAERDRQARIDRLATIVTPAKAPVHIDVLDVLTGLHAQLHSAAAALGTPPMMWSPFADPQPLLAWCREAARDAPASGAASQLARDMLHTIEHALGEIWDGQQLLADCPWCHGGISRKPSWRVRMLPGGTAAIVCESGACQPPEREAGTWWRGNPAWPLWEWEWLAQRVETDEQKRAAG